MLADTASITVHSPESFLGLHNIEKIIDRLDHYRRKAERLKLVNDLQRRLGSATDLASMVENFSIWLAPNAPHDLIAFKSEARNRSHMYCSCHGPARSSIMEVATEIFANGDLFDNQCFQEKDLFVQTFAVNTTSGPSLLLLIRRGASLELPASRIIRKVLSILTASLDRAMDHEDLIELARRDALTGLANRRVFEERLDIVLESARRYGYALTIAAMDLNRFKLVNDTFGHAEGDRVLKRVAAVLQGGIRRSDLLVRLGGDEFVLLMQDTDLAAARVLAQRLVALVDELKVELPGRERFGVSIGLAQWDKGMAQEEWLEKADENLYRAKKQQKAIC